jgi:hypothetical protein
MFLPILSPSAITTILDDLPEALLFCKDSNNRSNPKFSSGISISSAPAPMPAFKAMCLHLYPLLQQKNSLLWNLQCL